MFTGSILTKIDDETAIQEVVGQNGFIVSVLGRKRLTIAEIITTFNNDKSSTDNVNQ